MTVQLTSEFDFGDKVIIDGDSSLVGIVTSIEFRRKNVRRYEVSWTVNGDTKFVMFDDWRLSRA